MCVYCKCPGFVHKKQNFDRSKNCYRSSRETICPPLQCMKASVSSNWKFLSKLAARICSTYVMVTYNWPQYGAKVIMYSKIKSWNICDYLKLKWSDNYSLNQTRGTRRLTWLRRPSQLVLSWSSLSRSSSTFATVSAKDCSCKIAGHLQQLALNKVGLLYIDQNILNSKSTKKNKTWLHLSGA